MELNWLEISQKALSDNVRFFREIIGKDRKLGVAVKGNAYGHGLVTCSKVFVQAGVDVLCVNALYEAEILREAGLQVPILIMGHVPSEDLKRAIELDCDLIIYNPQSIEKLAEIGLPANLHLKIETGNHRQGVNLEELPSWIEMFKVNPQLKLKGLSTHFANIEDQANQSYAQEQLRRFHEAIDLLKSEDLEPEWIHCANTAATLLLPEAHFNFVRVGIGAYGLWPSEKTQQAVGNSSSALSPALSWKTRIAQIKAVKKGGLIGYGCTYQMPHDGKIAILPVGYYDGYPRHLSNKGVVLIKGQRAPVRGRICMNMLMVEVTEIPNLETEEEVVLMGKQGQQEVTVEELAEKADTINYELVTRLNENIKRKLVA